MYPDKHDARCIVLCMRYRYFHARENTRDKKDDNYRFFPREIPRSRCIVICETDNLDKIRDKIRVHFVRHESRASWTVHIGSVHLYKSHAGYAIALLRTPTILQSTRMINYRGERSFSRGHSILGICRAKRGRAINNSSIGGTETGGRIAESKSTFAISIIGRSFTRVAHVKVQADRVRIPSEIREILRCMKIVETTRNLSARSPSPSASSSRRKMERDADAATAGSPRADAMRRRRNFALADSRRLRTSRSVLTLPSLPHVSSRRPPLARKPQTFRLQSPRVRHTHTHTHSSTPRTSVRDKETRRGAHKGRWLVLVYNTE